MKMHNLSPAPGEKVVSKRLGRGIGSGLGKTSGKGHKGQNARSGGGVRPGFEGGQMPLIRRLPKRGFTNIFKKEYVIIDVAKLEIFRSGQKVDKIALIEKGLVKDKNSSNIMIKILGNKGLTKKLTVKVDAVSKSAQKLIEEVGGTIEVK